MASTRMFHLERRSALPGQPTMKIDLTCPAEVLRCRLNDENHNQADVTLNNLADKTVTSTEVTLVLHMREEAENTRVLYRVHDLHARGGDPFTFPVPLPEDTPSSPEKIEVIIEKIWYDDATVWRRGKAPLTEYESNALPAGRELERLRYVAGRQAVGYPQQQARVWLCVCGRPNANGAEQCVHCGNSREEVFRLYSEEAVHARIEAQENRLKAQSMEAMQTSNRRQLQRETQLKQKHQRQKHWLIALSIVCVLAVAGYATVFHLIPYLNYQSAVRLLENGEYDAAIAAFTAMDPYRDSADWLMRARYEKARSSLESADMETLEHARETFQSLGTYLDSATLLKQTDYQRAELLLGEGMISDATALFSSLGSYKDSPVRVTECSYMKAHEMLLSGNYETAMDAFEALGDYEDSKVMARECRIKAAESALDSGDPEHALSLLPDTLLGDDAVSLRQRAHYAIAGTLYEAGNVVEAGQEYLLAGNYADATDQARLCIYEPASLAMNSRDYLTAADMFASIPGYLDADDLALQCLYLAAKDALKDQEYTRATTLLSRLPVDYEDTDDMRKECVYAPALLAVQKGEYERAILAFQSLGDYKDSVRMISHTRYTYAQALEEEGRYEDAIAQYEMLGSYLRSAQYMKRARFAQAEVLFADGRYDEAMELYALVGDTASRERMQEIQYRQAQALYDAGSFAEAKDAFQSLGRYSDSRSRVKDCDLALAQALEASGQYAEALAAFQALKGYGDSDAHVTECQYQLACLARSAGDIDDALSAFQALGDYKDSAEQVHAIQFAKALALEEGGSLKEAAALFAALPDDPVAAAHYAAIEEQLTPTAEPASVPSPEVTPAEDETEPAPAPTPVSSESVWEMLYQEPAELSRKAAEEENWAYAAWILQSLDWDALPDSYQDLLSLYQSACEKEGFALLEEGEDAKAYPYLQRIWDSERVQELIEARRDLQILGIWENDDHRLLLSGDGTAELDGESHIWSLHGYLLSLDDVEAFSLTAQPDASQMVLRDRRASGIAPWTLRRTADVPLLPLPEADMVEDMKE
ncbi:MAG: tetratricopeptide repeat protein [Clostridia bacterium]|nr:tetratricopeptide repeat protein [Clostridia bacterium]